MSISTETILDSVSATLLDRSRRTWSRSELVGYLNEALTATANVKPEMFTVQEYVTLVAGNTQQLPAGGIALLDIDQNSTGRVVSQVDDALLDGANRLWPRATQQAEVEHFTADPRAPTRFKVFPPNDGTGSVQILYGAVPAALSGSSGEDIPVTDNYQAPLTNYVLGKAYAKNSKKQDLAKSASYMQQWGMLIGMKSKAQVAVAPKVNVTEGDA
jgi:hypothetical protein